MNSEQLKNLDEHLSKDFKRVAHNFEYKLREMMPLMSDAEAVYILNLTLKVIDQRFKNVSEE